MIEENVIKKSLQNLYQLINQYYEKLKIKNKETGITQEMLDYDASIYRNIEYKLIPFTQIFDLNNDNPYILNYFETEVLRQRIGIYNNGEIQTKRKLSKIFNVSPQTIDRTLKIIIRDISSPIYQKQFLDERNELIKKEIVNKKNKEKVLSHDINLLNITENLEEILRLENINTIKDIINIDSETIERINTEYGYYTNLRLFPKSIIEEIHDMGLKFKREKMISKTNDDLKKIEIPLGKILDIEDYTIKLKTVADILLAKQFEPEVLKTLSLEEELQIESLFDNSSMKNAYAELILSQIVQEKDKRVVTNIREQIKREFPYMLDHEIEEAIENATQPFNIYNYSEDKIKK